MSRHDILAQLDRELLEAQLSASFWSAQIPFHADECLKMAIERSLDRALRNAEELKGLKEMTEAGSLVL